VREERELAMPCKMLRLPTVAVMDERLLAVRIPVAAVRELRELVTTCAVLITVVETDPIFALLPT